MLEKDIENLIANYPKEFFPKEEFTLISQQYNVQNRRIDILFRDKYDRLIIVEVKRGILSREASGQIIEYYGLLKDEFPDKTIELILCANTIPRERKTFLENVGIECKEITLREIIRVSDKYKYTFSDDKEFKDRSIELKEFRQKTPSQRNDVNVWIFQANPQIYDILNALSDENIGDKIHWTVNQHKNKIKQGHLGLIWMSGKESGIYAIARIESNPMSALEYEAEIKYWHDTNKGTESRLRVKMTILKRLLNNPVFRDELKNKPELSQLSILRYFQGTNFPVSGKEWEVISKLIEERN